MRYISSLVIVISLITTACKTTPPVNPVPVDPKEPVEPIVPENIPPTPEIYMPSETRVFDLLHTRLEVSFDWSKSQLNGKAYLDLKPYFYATNTLVLDAKGFDVHKVGIVKDEIESELQFKYDGAFITITLDKEYTRKETIRVTVDYTAKPNDLEIGGSAAITADKGLYFINPSGEEEHKMPQIWTQGETEASSCWFPTIDAPNERMTQEIFMTVDKKYTTLSNGTFMFSMDNGDGTKVDYWKMDQPHAPYLAMMAIGEFVKVEDTWRDTVQVNYYVEKEWEQYAKDIFGATPEMMEFFSTKLGVTYPWNKYSQIVVRDYVSGAMENTTAVIHGDFLYRNKRELLDEHNESIIAHELFHHWFGDLVTCESWPNLALNESFANYSQFLWDEYKHGDDIADHNALIEMYGYLGEAREKQEDLIRYDVPDREDMFDAHSYNKGGRILHMLRNYVGDEAFFEALKLYLNDNAYDAAEAHHLRLAFEEVTGEDMNWFFNQWFFDKGHPLLDINYDYDAKNKEAVVNIKQTQNFDNTPLYKLPMKVDVYVNKSVTRHEIVLEKHEQEFRFPAMLKPQWVNVDATKSTLCVKTEHKDMETWAFQYRNGPRYLDRREALEGLKENPTDSLTQVIMFEALDDKFWGIQAMAMESMKDLAESNPKKARSGITKLIDHKEAPMRSEALNLLREITPEDNSLIPTYEKALGDSSYSVMSQGLLGINDHNPKQAVVEARKYKEEESAELHTAIAEILSAGGNSDDNAWFLDKGSKMSGFQSFFFVQYYAVYLDGQDNDELVEEGIPFFESRLKSDGPWWMKLPGYRGLYTLREKYQKKIEALKTKQMSLESDPNADIAEKARVDHDLLEAARMHELLDKTIEKHKSKETDRRLIRSLGG